MRYAPTHSPSPGQVTRGPRRSAQPASECRRALGLAACGASWEAGAGLDSGLVPVPAWVVVVVGAFVVLAVAAYLTVSVLSRRRRSR